MDNTGKTDLLSAEEIDQILTAISSDDDGNEREHDSERDQDSVRVRIVDFARLDAFNKREFMLMYQSAVEATKSMQRGLCKNKGIVDSAQKLRVRLASVDQLSVSDALRYGENPGYTFEVKIAWKKNPVYAFVNRKTSNFFKTGISAVSEDYAEGWKSASTIATAAVRCAAKALGNELFTVFSRRTVDPYLHDMLISKAAGAVNGVFFSWELVNDNTDGGEFSVFIPNDIVKETVHETDDQDRRSGAQMAQEKDKYSEKDIRVGVRAEIGRTSLPLEEIRGLDEGSIIELDTMVGKPMTVYVDGKEFGLGEVVALGRGSTDHYGIRLIKKL